MVLGATLGVPGEASVGFSAVREVEADRRGHRPTSEDSYVLRVDPENSPELKFSCTAPKLGPGQRYPKKFNESIVQERARDLCNCLSQLGRHTSTELATAGKALYDAVIPPEIWNQLQKAVPGAFLNLEISPTLAWIPWELLSYDGEEFFCTRFRMGRLPLRTPKELEIVEERRAEKNLELNAFIVIGATDAPMEAMGEGTEIEKIFKEHGKLAGINGALGHKKLLPELLKSYPVLHFIGHGFYDARSTENTGWQCRDGTLVSRKAIDETISKTTVPFLIFANACLSAHMSPTSEGFITSLYYGFFGKGVPHYIGTLAEVPQKDATEFAKVFYHALVRRASIGEALWKARLAFFDQPGAPIWAYYVHYGDPADRIYPEAPAESREKISVVRPAAQRRIVWRLVSAVAQHKRKILILLLFVLLLSVIAGYVHWRQGVFKTDRFGVAVASIDVKDMAGASVREYAEPLFSAQELEPLLAGFLSFRQPQIKTAPAIFRTHEEARQWGSQKQAALVLWGSAERGSKGLVIHLKATRIALPELHSTNETFQRRFLYRLFPDYFRDEQTFTSDFDLGTLSVDLTNPEQMQTVRRQAVLFVRLVGGVCALAEGDYPNSTALFEQIASSQDSPDDLRGFAKRWLVLSYLNGRMYERARQALSDLVDPKFLSGDDVVRLAFLQAAYRHNTKQIVAPWLDKAEKQALWRALTGEKLDPFLRVVAAILQQDGSTYPDLRRMTLGFLQTEGAPSVAEFERSLEFASRVAPNDYYLHYLVAMVTTREAVIDEELDKAEKINPQAAEPHFGRAITLHRRAIWVGLVPQSPEGTDIRARALDEIDKAITADPSQVTYWYEKWIL